LKVDRPAESVLPPIDHTAEKTKRLWIHSVSCGPGMLLIVCITVVLQLVKCVHAVAENPAVCVTDVQHGLDF
jgi:hypothetical protein